MNNGKKIAIIVVLFAVLAFLIMSGLNLENSKKKEFNALSEKVVTFADTTRDRVAKAIVTLPDGTLVVGLNNFVGSFTIPNKTTNGVVEVRSALLKTNFIPGIYGKRDPRLDAIVPMYVGPDSHGDSMYIVLFTDRGDVALEESYARLSNKAAIIESITTLAADENIPGEEYKVDVVYKLEGYSEAIKSLVTLPREVIIPVINGHFDAARTVSTPTSTSPTPKPAPEPKPCTQEAKQCPDGSYVGRSGPQCQFAECPTAQPVIITSTKTNINKKILNNGVYITPLKVVEDSRCPSDVTCIWAGTVKLLVKVEVNGKAEEATINLGDGITIDNKRITFTDVSPVPNSQKVITDGGYIFTFRVDTLTR